MRDTLHCIPCSSDVRVNRLSPYIWQYILNDVDIWVVERRYLQCGIDQESKLLKVENQSWSFSSSSVVRQACASSPWTLIWTSAGRFVVVLSVLFVPSIFCTTFASLVSAHGAGQDVHCLLDGKRYASAVRYGSG